MLLGDFLAIHTTSRTVSLPQSLHGPDGPWYLRCPSGQTQSKACKFFIRGTIVQSSCISAIIFTSNPLSKEQCASHFIKYLLFESLAATFVAALCPIDFGNLTIVTLESWGN